MAEITQRLFCPRSSRNDGVTQEAVPPKGGKIGQDVSHVEDKIYWPRTELRFVL